MSIHQVYLERDNSISSESRISSFTDDPEPRIFLDGEEEIVWLFRSGGSSPIIPLRVSSEIDEQLLDQGALDPEGRPWKLVFKEEGQTPLIVRNIWLIERRRVLGADKVLWFMGDRRLAIRSIMIDSIFNKMRSVNEFRRPSGVNVDPNIAQFSQVPLNHFVPFTCRTDPQPVNAQFAPGDTDEVQPWTALAGLLWLLNDKGFIEAYGNFEDLDGKPFRFGPTVITNRVVDRKILLKNFNPRTTWANAVNELARQARVMVYVNADGAFVVDDLTPVNSAFQGYGLYEGAGGVPVFASLSRNAPRRSKVFFPEWQEIRWEYDEKIAERISKGSRTGTFLDPRRLQQDNKTFFLENVVRMPQDTVRFQKGQWVDIYDALEDWRQDAAKFVRRTIKGDPKNLFTIENVRRFVLTTALANLWIRDPERLNFRSTVLEARVASIYQNYRRTFRIPEAWLDHIEDFQNVVAKIFSLASRARQPSPVWSDYYSWDNSVPRGQANANDRGRGYLINNPVDNFKGGLNLLQNDKLPASTTLLLDKTEPGPARINIIDKRQGVIQIDYPPDLTGVAVSYGPGLIVDSSRPTQRSYTFQLGSIRYKGSLRLLENYRFMTLLTTKWRSPNTPARFHVISTPGSRFVPGAGGPESHIFSSGFEAIKSWEDGLVTYNFNDPVTKGLAINHGGQLENESILDEIAEAQFQNLYFTYQPRIIGVYRAQGWTGQFPVGHVRDTALRFNQGAFETELNAERPPVKPSLWEFYSPETRNTLARFEAGTDLTGP